MSAESIASSMLRVSVYGMPFRSRNSLYSSGIFSSSGATNVNVRVEERHRLQQRVNGPAVFQVSDHGDMEAVERALRLLDRIEVEQRLARVLVGPVAGVDYRNLRYLARVAGRSLDRVAHDDQVAIVRYDHDRVMEGLAFRYARVGGLGKSDDPPPEVVDRARRS